MSFETDIDFDRLVALEQGYAKDPPTAHEIAEIREAYPNMTEIEHIWLDTEAANFEQQPSLL